MGNTGKQAGNKESGDDLRAPLADGSQSGIDLDGDSVSELMADTLMASPFLRWLRTDALQQLARSAELRMIDRGERLYSEGDPIDGVYVLLSGVIVLTKFNRRGSIVLHAGSVIGGAAATGRATSAQADSPSVVLRIPNGLFTILCRHEPTLRTRLRRCMIGHKRPS